MNIRQLRYFVTVADTGSVSRAAVTLGVAQPALSVQIATLEKELGAVLLLRTSRGVQTTEAGKICYRSARVIIDEIERMRGALVEGEGLSGEVSFGLTTTFAVEFTDSIVVAVRACYPRIRLQIFDAASHVLEEKLLQGSLDMAILHDAVARTGLRRRPLFEQRLFAVERSGASTSEAATIELTELVGRKLVLPTIPNATRTVVDKAFAAIGAKPVVAAEANSRNGLLALVAGGSGATVLAWGGPPDPAFRWRKICKPALYHEVSLCTGRILAANETTNAVERIVVDVVATAITQPDWAGAEISKFAQS